MILQVLVIGVMGGGGGWSQYRSTKWNTRLLKARGPVYGLHVLIALQIEDNRHLPALRGLSSPPSTNTRKP